MENNMDLTKFSNGVAKTGFKLEFDISQILAAHGWTVINNKYYIDDQQESVREIDLVAYKARLVQGFYVYTTLIISCKKNEKEVWALLSKDRNHKDPNINWLPVHAWSNDRAVGYMLNGQEWREKYLNNMKDAGCISIASAPKKHIFAFQEMNRESGSPNNDKNIFSSVVSLMKAQAYEMSALPNRKKDPVTFQFNLMSIADTDLVRLDFSKKGVNSHLVEDEVYVAGYIIDKQQTFAKIHFINASSFDVKLAEYDRLHEENVTCFGAISNDFYVDAAKVDAKQKVFLQEVRADIWLPIHRKVRKSFNKGFDRDSVWLFWDKEALTLLVMLMLDEDQVEVLNQDSDLRALLVAVLKKYYRYTGPSKFDSDDIPF